MRLAAEHAALAVGDQHDRDRVDARKELHPAGPALAFPAAVLHRVVPPQWPQQRVLSCQAASDLALPRRDLVRRHDALGRNRAQVYDRPQHGRGPRRYAHPVLGDREREVPRADLAVDAQEQRLLDRQAEVDELGARENQRSAAVAGLLEAMIGFWSASTRKRASGALLRASMKAASQRLCDRRSRSVELPRVGFMCPPETAARRMRARARIAGSGLSWARASIIPTGWRRTSPSPTGSGRERSSPNDQDAGRPPASFILAFGKSRRIAVLSDLRGRAR